MNVGDGAIGSTVGWYTQRKGRMLAYLGSVCAQCGETSNLQFDHIDPTTKAFNVTACYSFAWETVKAELDKCQLLCSGCHLAKTLSERPEVHNRHRYGKCLCDICRLDRNLYRRQRYAEGKKI